MDKSTAIQLYLQMLRIRRAEEKIIEIYPSDKIQSPVHLSIGQESVSVGVCAAMRAEDRIYGTYRSHALYVAKSGDLNKMFAELYGKDTGCARGKGGSMHLVDPARGLMGCSAIVSSTIPVATGHALASKMQGRKYAVISFFGDGGVDEGVFFESVNFAILKNLPVLYLIENNGYAIHSKIEERRKQTDLHKICEGLGMKGERFDGTDVYKVYEETQRALDAIRKGGEPRILEFTIHRWKEHVGINEDFQESYHKPGDKELVLKSDSINKARATLIHQYKVSGADFEQWDRDIRAEVERGVEFAEKSPFPHPSRLLEDVFA